MLVLRFIKPKHLSRFLKVEKSQLEFMMKCSIKSSLLLLMLQANQLMLAEEVVATEAEDRQMRIHDVHRKQQ